MIVDVTPEELALIRGNADKNRWKVFTKVAKFEGDWTGEEIDAGLAGAPYEVVENEDNMIMIGGSSALWQCLIGNGTGTAAQTLTYFNNGNAMLGAGDSATAEANTQTDLQAVTGSTHRQFKAMDATYPLHTDSLGTVGSQTITFRATFASAEANFAWAEWCLSNWSSATTTLLTTGRILNRKVAANGTKASGASWQFTVTIQLS